MNPLELMVNALRAREAQAKMPFPDNRNPDMDFANRWPNLPPSGIMNDLKPNMDPGLPMVRRLDMTNKPFPYE